MIRVVFTIASICLCAGVPLRAADLLPPEQSIESAIDHYVDQLISQDDVQTAPQINEYLLVRRLTLDLAGRIPTTAELHAFVAADPASRRA